MQQIIELHELVFVPGNIIYNQGKNFCSNKTPQYSGNLRFLTCVSSTITNQGNSLWCGSSMHHILPALPGQELLRLSYRGWGLQLPAWPPSNDSCAPIVTASRQYQEFHTVHSTFVILLFFIIFLHLEKWKNHIVSRLCNICIHPGFFFAVSYFFTYNKRLVINFFPA